jgi:DNA-binding MarR family transcriptional regulator
MPRNDAKSPSRRPARRGGTRRAASPPAPSPAPPSATAVLQQFRELFRVSQQHFQRIESHCGVSGAQLWALSELSSAPGLSVSQLARKMSIHLSTSSNLLDKLEAQGFVRRERGTDDQRIVRIFLTASGQRMLKKAPRPVEGVIPDALAKMPAQALRSLQRDLGLLLDLACVRSPGAALKPLAEP